MSLLRPIKPKKLVKKGIPYNHCTIRKGNVYEVSYIPKQFAKVGEVLKIKREGVWDDGWIVESVGNEVDESVIDALYEAWKHHAGVSDI